jgi:hypothetical protein
LLELQATGAAGTVGCATAAVATDIAISNE